MPLKTNMRMNVAICGETVSVEHRTGLVDVNDLVKVGNYLRVGKKLPFMAVPTIRRRKDLTTFVEAVNRQVQQGHYRYFDVPDELIFSVGKGGVNATTKAFLPIALKIAAIMDADFEAEVYRVFIEEKILHYRDESGEQFKALNIIIDAYLPGREGKDNRGVYIAVATLMRDVVFPGVVWDTASQGNIWNSELATGDALRRRDSIEGYLCGILKDGLVRDFEHLKQIISNHKIGR